MRQAVRTLTIGLGLLFALSGATALIYQIAWQRLIFITLGVELSVVTIVISAFMLGLGLGGIVGGWAADYFPKHRVKLFSISEFGIGIFGALSPYIFSSFGDLSASHAMSNAETYAIIFFILLIPTTLMGATLPILVTQLSHHWKHIGRSTGALYAANTFGAMAGSFAAGYFIFNHMELSQTIYIASGANMFIAAAASVLSFMRPDA